ncbi:MAG: sigma-70 family RNA polymerase sigma factor [Bacilli bacterium]|nr:sigma-70 family RNA polymerase sigma factor [Bacilli bacterium]
MTNELIIKHQNLVYFIMHYFENYNNKEDLFQVGCLGLIKAYQNYDENKNTKFSTYAYTYILGEMRKLVREDKQIKISRDITKINLKIEKAKILLSQKLMREPSINELSKYLEIPENMIVESIKSNQYIYSIDSKINDENDLLLKEVIANNNIDLDILISLKQEMLNLSKKERIIITESINNNLNQTELAQKLGMTQVQISRQLKKIKTKIKQNLLN